MTPLAEFRTVAEDLAFLRESFAPGADERSLRYGSAVLRRLLVDGGQGILPQAWRAAGFAGQPIVKAPDLLALVGGTFDGIAVAVAGAADPGGVIAGGVVLFDGPNPRPPKVAPGENFMERAWSLSAYVSAPTACANGESVSRRDVIQVLRQLPGRSSPQCLAKVRKKEEASIRLLRRVQRSVEVRHKNRLLFELLSFGQALSASEDVIRLEQTLLGAS